MAAKPKPAAKKAAAKIPDAREALLKAATALFAARGFSGVSVRDIAARAKVNHGLVHRHFGSKEALLRAVMQREADHLATTAGQGIARGDANTALTERIFDAAQSRDVYWRILARSLLDGRNPRDLQIDFPTLRRLIENRVAAGLSRNDAAIETMALVAACLGYLVFEPFLGAASGLDKKMPRAAMRQAFLRKLDKLN